MKSTLTLFLTLFSFSLFGQDNIGSVKLKTKNYLYFSFGLSPKPGKNTILGITNDFWERNVYLSAGIHKLKQLYKSKKIDIYFPLEVSYN